MDRIWAENGSRNTMFVSRHRSFFFLENQNHRPVKQTNRRKFILTVRKPLELQNTYEKFLKSILETLDTCLLLNLSISSHSIIQLIFVMKKKPLKILLLFGGLKSSNKFWICGRIFALPS
jgi:hypothetical protein